MEEEKIHFDEPTMAILNINLKYLEDLSIEQRKNVLEVLVDYWSEKDGYPPGDLLPKDET